MAELVRAERPDLLEAAVAALGADPFEHLDDGTAYLQPAIYCASMAQLARRTGPEPEFYAGHSLGELAALVAAGSLGAADGLRVVLERGRLMQRASEEAPQGAMLAIGAGGAFAARLAAATGLSVANDNAPDQVVLSGDADAIARAWGEARRQDVRAFRLPIKGAFHSSRVSSVVPEFRAALARVEFRAPRRPVLSCVTAVEFDDIPRRLAQALTHGVRWREVVLTLHARGVRRFVEIGPGRVLTGLVLRTLPGAAASTIDAPVPADA